MFCPITPPRDTLCAVKQEATRIVVIHAPEDDAIVVELEKHLALLLRGGQALLWSQRDSQAGDYLQATFEARLQIAHIVLLMVSAELLSSDFCHRMMDLALTRHSARDAKVIPVIVRACDWSHGAFAGIAPLPHGGAPIIGSPNPASIWEEVARGIRLTVEQSLVGPRFAPLEPRTNQTLPPNNLPPRRLFVGREDALRGIDSALAPPGTMTITQASVWGLGGIGKTALALEYAYRHAASYPGGLWWIAAEGRPREALGHLVGTLRAHGPDTVRRALDTLRVDAPMEECVRAVRDALQNHSEPALLVLDNVSELGAREMVPAGRVRVLMTTRDERLTVGHRCRLDVLSRDDATALAESIAGACTDLREREACSRVVSGELGGLAVAVEVAARAVEQWLHSWTAYERHLREAMPRLLDDPSLRGDYDKGVFAALDLSIDRCAAATPERRLLNAIAAFAPDAVPFVWASVLAAIDPAGIDAAKARSALRGLGLITPDDERQTVLMHRLIHRRVRVRAAEEDPSDWLETRALSAMIVTHWLGAMLDPTNIAAIDRHRPLIDEALNAANEVGDGPGWIDLANLLTRHIQHRAGYAEAESLFEQVLARAEALVPPDPARVAGTVSNLGAVFWESGRPHNALPHFKRALALADANYPPTHGEIARNLGNLALVHRALGHPAEALPMLERAATIAEDAHGVSDPLVGVALSNLAATLLELDRKIEAATLARRALKIAEDAFGPEHPDVARCLSCLAMALDASKDSEEVRSMLERALTINENVYGPNHPIVARCLSNLVPPLTHSSHEEDWIRAQMGVDRAIAILERSYGPEHPELAITLSNSAIQLARGGQAAAALPLFERALTMVEKISGPVHPHIALLCSNLAEAFTNLGDALSARPLLDRALTITEAVYGPDHSSQGIHLLKLAKVHALSEDWPAAVQALQRGLEIMERSCGSEDPEIVDHLVELGKLQDQLGEPALARPLLERALVIDEARLGPEHEVVGARLCNLAIVLLDLDLVEEARLHLARALVIVERASGAHHPTARTIRSLLVTALNRLGRPDEGLLLIERILALTEEIHGAEHHDVAFCLSNLANVLLDLGRTAETLPHLERLLAIVEREHGPQHPEVALVLARMLRVLGLLERRAELRPLLDRILSITHSAVEPERAMLREALDAVMHVFLRNRLASELRPLHEKDLAAAEAEHGPDHPAVAAVLSRFAVGLWSEGRAAEARPLLDRALTIEENTLGVEHPVFALDLSNMSGVLQALGLFEEGRELLERADAIAQRVLPIGDPRRDIITGNLVHFRVP